MIVPSRNSNELREEAVITTRRTLLLAVALGLLVPNGIARAIGTFARWFYWPTPQNRARRRTGRLTQFG